MEGGAGIGQDVAARGGLPARGSSRPRVLCRPRLGAGGGLRLRGRPSAVRAAPGGGAGRRAQGAAGRPAAAARPLLSGERGRAAGHRRVVRRPARPLLAGRQPGRPPAAACSSSTTCTGRTARRCAGSPTWQPRVEGLALALLVATRPAEPAIEDASMQASARRGAAVAPARAAEREPASRGSPAHALGEEAERRGAARSLQRATGGNPFYLARAAAGCRADGSAGRGARAGRAARRRARGDRPPGRARLAAPRPARRWPSPRRWRSSATAAELRQGAAVARRRRARTACALAAGLVRLEVLAGDDPPRFLHPIVRDAVEASLGSDERDAAAPRRRPPARCEGAPPGQVAAHLVRRPAGGRSVGACAHLREAARAAMRDAARRRRPPSCSRRALAEPPRRRSGSRCCASWPGPRRTPGARRRALGSRRRCRSPPIRGERAEIALEVAEAYAALFRWVEAVDVIERALARAGRRGRPLWRPASRASWSSRACTTPAARARCAPALERLGARQLAGAPAEALAVAQGMAMVLAGPAGRRGRRRRSRRRSHAAAPRVENWDTRPRCCGAWSPPSASRRSRPPRTRWSTEVHRTGQRPRLRRHLQHPRACSSCASAHCRRRTRLRASRCACSRRATSRQGWRSRATVLADVADRGRRARRSARGCSALLPQAGWPPGVGTRADPGRTGSAAARAGPRWPRLCADFETCGAMFSTRGLGHGDARCRLSPRPLRRRPGAAAAWASATRPVTLADAELADVRGFGAPRALGVALARRRPRRGGEHGLELLRRVGRRAAPTRRRCWSARKSLAELGAALRRAGQRTASRELLAEALDLAARCGARPLAGAGPRGAQGGRRPTRREWRRGVEALTPSELRVARLAADGQHQPGDRAGALRDAEDRRRAPRPCLRQARDRRPWRARAGARRARKDQGGHPVANDAADRATVSSAP